MGSLTQHVLIPASNCCCYKSGSRWTSLTRVDHHRGTIHCMCQTWQHSHIQVGGPWHNVEQVNAEGYENCSGFSNTEGVEGPYVFKAKREGEFYFVCGVGGHCADGNQKAIVTVKSDC